MNNIKLTIEFKMINDKFQVATHFDPVLPGPSSEAYKNLSNDEQALVALAGNSFEKMLDHLKKIGGDSYTQRIAGELLDEETDSIN